jgi:hypothetical protein
MTQGIVFVADFIRAWAAFDFSEASLPDVASRCGLAMRELAESPPSQRPPVSEPARPRASVAPPGLTLGEERQTPVDVGPPDLPRHRAQPAPAVEAPGSAPQRLEPLEVKQSPRMPISGWWAQLEPLAPSPPPSSRKPTPPEPLLRREWQRTILAEIAASDFPEGEPDLPAIVEQIAAQKPVKSIPRRSIKSIRRGLCCFIDKGDGMMPFAADQTMLVHALRIVLGRESVSICYFRGTPIRMREGRAACRKAVRNVQPILVVTDLGIGRPRFSADPASVSDWLRFAASLKHSGSRLLALVPYPPERRPRVFDGAGITILFWDPSTNTSPDHARRGAYLHVC